MLLMFSALACDESPRPPRVDYSALRSAPIPLPTDAAPESTAPREPTRWSPQPETLDAIAVTKSTAWRHWPRPLPAQRIAFFAHNLAVLEQNAVSLVPLGFERGKSPCQSNRLEIDQPRELATMADQTLLVIGAKISLLVDSNCSTRKRLPKVSYLPGSRLLEEPRWPKAFALLDTANGNLARFRWQDDPKSTSGYFLPTSTLDDVAFKGGACALMRDGSLACASGQRIYVSWPGYHGKNLGPIAPGAAVVRLLPAERADHVRVVRDDSSLEEYWLAPGLPRMRAFTLPAVAFDVVAGDGYLAVLQVETTTAGTTELRLVILEPDGTLRWSLPVGHMAANQTEQRRHHEFFECWSIVAHPIRPHLALGNCERVDVFDALTGRNLERFDRSAR